MAGANLPAGCGGVGGDFFQSVPEGGDAYLLKAVLHDWRRLGQAGLVG